MPAIENPAGGLLSWCYMQIHDGWLIVSADAPLNAHNGFQEVMGRGKHWRNTSSMDEALQAEGEDDNSDNSHSHCTK
jgi:hypothetical protein